MKISELARRCGWPAHPALLREAGGDCGHEGAPTAIATTTMTICSGCGWCRPAGRRAQPQAVPRLSGGRAGSGNAGTRVRELDEELARMQRARDLLADLAGLRAHSGDEFKAWQQQLQHQAPQAYFAWVMKQGFQ